MAVKNLINQLQTLALELHQTIQSDELFISDSMSYKQIIENFRINNDINQFQTGYLSSLLSYFDLAQGSLIDKLKLKYQSLIEAQIDSLIATIRNDNDPTLTQKDLDALAEQANDFKRFIIANTAAAKAHEKIFELFPETKYLKEDAESSPAGAPTLSTYSFARLLYGDQVHNTAIELDRTVMGSILFLDALAGNQDRFRRLDDEAFNAYRSTILKQTIQNQFLVLVMLITNDLGKAYEFENLYQSVFNSKSINHDQALGALMVTHPEYFPGIQTYLSATQQELYIRSLIEDTENLQGAYTPNLGQDIQAENTPNEMAEFSNKPKEVRVLRTLEQIADIAGATGHINPFFSIIMDKHLMKHLIRHEEEISRQSIGKTALTLNDMAEIRLAYLAYRAHYAGLTLTEDKEALRKNPELYALSRLVALRGINDENTKNHLLEAWNQLDSASKETLIRELNITGVDGIKAILLYWFPALLQNADNGTHGLLKGLEAAAAIYNDVRGELIDQENGSHTVKVNHFAAAFKNPDKQELLRLLDALKPCTKTEKLYRHKKDDNLYVKEVIEKDAENYEAVELSGSDYRRILSIADSFFSSSHLVPQRILDRLENSHVVEPIIETTTPSAKEDKEDTKQKKTLPVEPEPTNLDYKKDPDPDEGGPSGNTPGAPGSGGNVPHAPTPAASSNNQGDNSQTKNTATDPKAAVDTIHVVETKEYLIEISANKNAFSTATFVAPAMAAIIMAVVNNEDLELFSSNAIQQFSDNMVAYCANFVGDTGLVGY